MDVGPFVVADAQPAKLIQPRKRPFHHPSPASQAAAVPRSTDGQQRVNVAGAQTVTDGLRIIRAIAENAVRTVPWSPSLALERRNRIDERQRFLRIMTVGTGQTDRERHAPAVADHMAFAPSLSPVGGIWTRLRSTTHCSHGTTIHDRPRPIDLVVASQPIQHRKMNQIPHSGQLPIAQTSPARHPGAAAQFSRQHLPREPTAKDKEDAGEARSVRDARPSTFRSSWRNRQERFDEIPQYIREQRCAHSCQRYRAGG